MRKKGSSRGYVKNDQNLIEMAQIDGESNDALRHTRHYDITPMGKLSQESVVFLLDRVGKGTLRTTTWLT